MLSRSQVYKNRILVFSFLSICLFDGPQVCVGYEVKYVTKCQSLSAICDLSTFPLDNLAQLNIWTVLYESAVLLNPGKIRG